MNVRREYKTTSALLTQIADYDGSYSRQLTTYVNLLNISELSP